MEIILKSYPFQIVKSEWQIFNWQMPTEGIYLNLKVAVTTTTLRRLGIKKLRT